MNFLLTLVLFIYSADQVLLPIKISNRKDVSSVKLTNIGEFGLVRKARKEVPQHYHTGIDIQRPNKNYGSEPIFPIASGKVISRRMDGPFANLIIEHEIDGMKFWSLYEHIAGITVHVNETVDVMKPVARFMNKEELDKYGWQFDHVHLEILKIKPQEIKPDKKQSERFFNSYTLTCFEKLDLEKHYFEPMNFLKRNVK